MSALLAAVGLSLLVCGAPPSIRRLGTSQSARPWIRRAAGLRPVPVAALVVLGVGVTVGAAAAVASAITAATVMRRMRRTRTQRDGDRERDAVAAALDVVISELRAGAHPARACQQAATDASGAAAAILSQCAGRAELGGDVAAGIRSTLAAGQPSVVAHLWSRVAVAWETATEFGLPMADMLTTVRSDLLARRRFAAQTTASLAGPRATSTVLALLPVVGIGLGQLMGAAPLTVLTGPGLGGYLLIAGALLVSAGLWWSDAIGDRVTR